MLHPHYKILHFYYSALPADVQVGVYARRRARAAQHWAVPTLAILATDAVPGAPPREKPLTIHPVPSLARLVTNKMQFAKPLDSCDLDQTRPIDLDQMFDKCLEMYEAPKQRLNKAVPEIVIEPPEDTVESMAIDASVHTRRDGSQVTDALLSDVQPADSGEGVEDVPPMPVDSCKFHVYMYSLYDPDEDEILR